MSDQFRDEFGQGDDALAPELARLDELLLAEGQRWRRNEPSTARLERHVQALARPGVALPRNEERMLSERNQALDTPTPQPILRPTPPRGRGLLALVATVLLVAMAASVFAFLRTSAVGTGSGHTGPRATPTAGFTRIVARRPTNTRLPLSTGEHLSSLSFSSANDGWAVGGVFVPDTVGSAPAVKTHALFIHYHNGVWERGVDAFSNISLDDVSMLSASDGWAVGQVVIASSATRPTDHYTGAVLFQFAGDGSGGHWRMVSEPALATLQPDGIHMFSPNSGYITGVVDGTSTTPNVAPSPYIAIAVDQNGMWTMSRTPFAAWTSQVVMASPSEGWAITLEAGTSIFHYLNGVWTKALSLPIGYASISLGSTMDVWVSGVAICHTDACYAEGDHAAIYHYNGSTWELVPSTVALSAGKSGMSVTFIYDGLASGVWFATQTNSGLANALLWTRQGGDWTSASPRLPGAALLRLTADGNGGMWAIMQSQPTSPTQTTEATTVLYTQGTTWVVYGQN